MNARSWRQRSALRPTRCSRASLRSSTASPPSSPSLRGGLAGESRPFDPLNPTDDHPDANNGGKDGGVGELLRRCLDRAAASGLKVFEAARLLGALCIADKQAVRNLDDLLSWSFLRLSSDSVTAQMQQLALLRQLLATGNGQHYRAVSFASSIVSNVQVFLHSTQTTDALDEALSIFELAASLYPSQFSRVFLGVMDTLIGWRLDLNVPTPISASIGQRFVEHFAGMWSDYFPTEALELLDKFLFDMDILSLKCDDLHLGYKSLERFSLCFLMIVECLSPATLVHHSSATGSLLSRLFTHCFSQRSAVLRKSAAALWITEKWHSHCFFVVSKLSDHALHAFAPAFSACLKFMHSHLASELSQSPSHSSVLNWLKSLTDVVLSCGAFLPVAAVQDLLRPSSPFQVHIRTRFLMVPQITAALASLYLALLRSTMAFSQPVVFQSLSAEFTAYLELCATGTPPSGSQHRLLLFNLALFCDRRFARLLFTDPRGLHQLLGLLLQVGSEPRLSDELRFLVIRTLSFYVSLAQPPSSSSSSSSSSSTFSLAPASPSSLASSDSSSSSSSVDDIERQIDEEGRQVLASRCPSIAQVFLDQLHARTPHHLEAYLLEWLCSHYNLCARLLRPQHFDRLFNNLSHPGVARILPLAMPCAFPLVNERLAVLLLRHPELFCPAAHDRFDLLARLLCFLPPLANWARFPEPPPATDLPSSSRARQLLHFLLGASSQLPASAPWSRADVAELVRDCLENRLTTSIGRPHEFFEALEGGLRSCEDPVRLYWLVQFSNSLERSIRLLSAHELPYCLNLKAHQFFVDHAHVCANWFFRMRASLLQAAIRCGTSPADVLLLSGRKFPEPPASSSGLRQAVAESLFALHDADSLATRLDSNAQWVRPLALHAASRFEEALEIYEHQGLTAAPALVQQHAERCKQALSGWERSAPGSSSSLSSLLSGTPSSNSHSSSSSSSSSLSSPWIIHRDDLAPAQLEPLLVQHVSRVGLTAERLLLSDRAGASPYVGTRDPQFWRNMFAVEDGSLDTSVACLTYLRKRGNVGLAQNLLQQLGETTVSVRLELERLRLNYDIADGSYAANSSECLLQLAGIIKSNRTVDAASLAHMYLLQGKWIRQQQKKGGVSSSSSSSSSLLQQQDFSTAFFQPHASLFSRLGTPQGSALGQLAQLLGYDRQPLDAFHLSGHCFEKAANLVPVDGGTGIGVKAWQRFADFAFARALAVLPSQLDGAGELILLTDAEKAAIGGSSESAVTQIWTAITEANVEPSPLRVMVRHRVLKHFSVAAINIGHVLRRPDQRARQYAVRLLSLLIHFGGGQDDLSTQLVNSFAESAGSWAVWTDLLPQLLVWLGHESPAVRDALSALLTRIGNEAPRLVVYSILAVLARKPRSAHQDRARNAVKCIFATLQERHSSFFVAARTVFGELARISELHEERWYRILKSLVLQNPPRELLVQRVEALYNDTLLAEPETPHERRFVASCRELLDAARVDIIKAQTPEEGLAVLRQLMSEFAAKRHSTALLSSLSPSLLDMAEVPAFPWMMQCGGADGSPGAKVFASFLPDVTILPTKTRPRRLCLQGEDGRVYPVLLKGGEDLRMDERMMQWVRAANECLALDAPCASRNLHAKHYAVVPLSTRVGLIEWVDGGQQLFSLYTAHELAQRQQQLQQRKSADNNGGSGSSKSSAQQQGDGFVGGELEGNRASTFLATKKYHAYATKALQAAGYDLSLPRSSWPLEVQRSIFLALRDETPSDLLFDALWRNSPHAMSWWETTTEFTRSLAVMSMVGHIIGLGDRHLDNMLINYRSGQVMHIDYNVCFEKGKRLSVPETVPFRLTQNLHSAVALKDVSSEEGQFSKSCRLAFSAMCASQETMVTLLETFVYDPIVDWDVGHLPSKLTAAAIVATDSGSEASLSSSSSMLGGQSSEAAMTAYIEGFVGAVHNYYYSLAAQHVLRILNPTSSPVAAALQDLAARATAHLAILSRFVADGVVSASSLASPPPSPSSSSSSSASLSSSPSPSPTGRASKHQKRKKNALLAAPVNSPPAAGVLQAQLSVLRRTLPFDSEFLQRCESLERQARLLDEERQNVARELHQLLTDRLRDADVPSLCRCSVVRFASLRSLLSKTIDQLSPSDVAAALAELGGQQAMCRAEQPSPLGALVGRLNELQEQLVQTEVTYQQHEDLIHRRMNDKQGADGISGQDLKRFEARVGARRQSARDKFRTLQPLAGIAQDYLELEECRAKSSPAGEFPPAGLLHCLDELAAVVGLKHELGGAVNTQANVGAEKVTIDATIRDLQLLSASLPPQNSFVVALQALADEISITQISPNPQKLRANWGRVHQQLVHFPDFYVAAVTAKSMQDGSGSSNSSYNPVEPAFGIEMAASLAAPSSSASLSRGNRSVLRYHGAGKNAYALDAVQKIQEKMSVPPESTRKHVQHLIEQALAVDNLCRNYEGWLAWF